MKRCKVFVLVCMCIFVTACSTRPDKSSIEDKRTQKEKSTEKQTTVISIKQEIDSYVQEETEEYVPGPEDVLASQAYFVGTEIKHEKKDGKEVIKYKVNSGDIAFNAGMMMFVNGIPQSFTDETGNSMYISNIELGTNDFKTQYYTCDFNNVEESESYVCIEKNMVMPDIMVVKRKGFFMGHLQTLTAGRAHEVQCNNYTDVDMGALQTNVVEDVEAGYIYFEGYIGDDKLSGTVVERADVKNVTFAYTPNTDGDVVITFWGNNVPIQVGEHMYYKFSVEEGNEYSYSFELDEELVSSVDNFFITAALLCDDMGSDDVQKTATCIFVDKYE